MKNEISYLYLKIHNVTKLKYLGATYNNPYKYLGSGVEWKKHIKKYGRYDVKTIILFKDKMNGKNTSDKFQKRALWWSKILDVVKNENFANMINENGVLGAVGTVYYGHKDETEKWDSRLEKSFQKENSKYEITKNFQQVSYNDFAELPNQFNNAVQSSLKEITAKVLSTLTPREERIIRMRFGIGYNSDYSLGIVGEQFSVRQERIRQIEAKALRKLKHPSRSRKLRSFLGDNILSDSQNEENYYVI